MSGRGYDGGMTPAAERWLAVPTNLDAARAQYAAAALGHDAMAQAIDRGDPVLGDCILCGAPDITGRSPHGVVWVTRGVGAVCICKDCRSAMGDAPSWPVAVATILGLVAPTARLRGGHDEAQ